MYRSISLQFVTWLRVLSAKSWSHDQASYVSVVAPLLLKVYRISCCLDIVCSYLLDCYWVSEARALVWEAPSASCDWYMWRWRRLLPFTVDMIIPILMAEVSSDIRLKLFILPFVPWALPNCRSLMSTCSRVGVRNETGETWPDIFPLFGAGIGTEPVLVIVPVAERHVSRSI